MSNEDHVEPIPLIKPLPEATEVPLADLGSLVEPIEAIMTLTQAPAGLALQGVLAAISLATQGQANVETFLEPVPLSLFLFSIAESSSRKSGVDSLATRAIRDFETPLLTKYHQEVARYESAERSSGRRRDTCLVIDDGTDAFLDTPLTPPVDPKMLFDDLTYEGIVRHFVNGQPSIGLFSDEAGKIIGGPAMAPQNQLATAAALSNLWDGKAINKTRAGSGSISLANRRASLHFAIQPTIADALFANELIRDQGFLSRVLVTKPDSLAGTRLISFDEESMARKKDAEDALARFHARVTEILNRTPETRDQSSLEVAPRTLRFEASAYAKFVDFQNCGEEQQLEGLAYADIRGFAGKATEQAARIAGNIAIFEDVEATTISADQLAVATSLMQFYLDEALRVYVTGGVSKKVRNAELLGHWIRNKWDEDHIDLTAINRYGPNALRSSPSNRELLSMLKDYDWLLKPDAERVLIKERWSRKAYRVNRN